MGFWANVRDYKLPIALNLTASAIAQLVPLYYNLPSLQEATKSHAPLIASFIVEHPYHVFVINWVAVILLPMLSIPQVRKVISRAIPMDAKCLGIFLSALEQPVQLKLDRFANALKDAKGATKKVKAKDTFNAITQPRIQCQRIVDAMYSFYCNVDDLDTKFKVVLYFIDEEKIKDNAIYAPLDSPPTTPVKSLSAQDSPIMTAVRKREPVILESVRSSNGSAKFVFRDQEDHRDGSLLCYPIMINHIGSAPMVLSIFTDTPKYFNKENRVAYDYVFKKFQNRLAIEYCLMVLKDATKTSGGPS